MSRQVIRITLVLSLVVGLAATAAGVGFVAGRTSVAWLPEIPGLTLTRVSPTLAPSAGGTPQELQSVFSPFWEAWRIVNTQYVDQPLDPVKLMRGALSGMIAALGDEHSSYMDPNEYRMENALLAGSYEGIGAEVDVRGTYVTVVSTYPGSPAEQAGLQPGDEFIRVDGQDMTGLDGNAVILRVLGPAGSKVSLSVRRQGVEGLLEFTLVRAKITMPETQSKMLAGGIAYVRLFTFGDNADADLRKALGQLLTEKPKGLILDLRGNLGGALQAALDVASEFLPDGKTVLLERYGDGREETLRTHGGGMATEIPLVVLVNEGSASASEVVAGALQDFARAQLVGETTFGKGSVQNWVPLSNDQGAVRITIARWYTPKGRQINKTGLTPDVVVPLTDADRTANRDPQLDRAIGLLQGGS